MSGSETFPATLAVIILTNNEEANTARASRGNGPSRARVDAARLFLGTNRHAAFGGLSLAIRGARDQHKAGLDFVGLSLCGGRNL